MVKTKVLLKVPRCQQSIPGTCGPISLLTILNKFDQSIRLSKKNEFIIWSESALLPLRLTMCFGLALSAIKRGFSVIVFKENKSFVMPRISESTLFHESIGGKINMKVVKYLYQYQKDFVIASTNSKILHKKIDNNDISTALEFKLPVMVMIYDDMFKENNEALHWIVIKGESSEGTYYINDSSPNNYREIEKDRLLKGLNIAKKGCDSQALIVYPKDRRVEKKYC